MTVHSKNKKNHYKPYFLCRTQNEKFSRMSWLLFSIKLQGIGTGALKQGTQKHPVVHMTCCSIFHVFVWETIHYLLKNLKINVQSVHKSFTPDLLIHCRSDSKEQFVHESRTSFSLINSFISVLWSKSRIFIFEWTILLRHFIFIIFMKMVNH